ncbi:MAG TPA: cation:proton antiporter [Dehalococcoidia bacterium]|nr:cation:proton antiporter [Dehalococcoidia bacterium]
MSEIDFPLDIAIVLTAALIGGIAARLLRLPVIAGYILAGMAFGPETPGVDLDPDQMQDVAELGVVLLMFALGVEFSFEEVSALGKTLPLAALAQVVLTIPLGLLMVVAFSLNVTEAIFLGGIISVSSTFVALKVLDDAGELASVSGRVVVTFCIVQDLAVVALVNILPELEGEADNVLRSLGIAIVVAVSFLFFSFFLGVRVIPPLFERIATIPIRELFLLAVLSLGLGMALAAEQAGLSLAFGAFLAGLVVSESRYGLQALAQTLPFRDIFATVFFVAIGMLIDPEIFLDEPLQIAFVVGLIVLGKGALTFAAARVAGVPGEPAMRAGLTLAQIGEFSFVLALVGIDEGIVSEELNEVVLAAVLLTILISTLSVTQSARLTAALRSLPLGEQLAGGGQPLVTGVQPTVTRHVVICGYGRTGREVARVLQRREFSFIVVEHDPGARRQAEMERLPLIYGDASSPVVLERCALERARLLAITFGDRASAELVMRNALLINPRLDIVVRAGSREAHERFLELGASEVVHPEVEGGLEFVRHTLRRYGLPQQEIQAIIARRRTEFFRAQDRRE